MREVLAVFPEIFQDRAGRASHGGVQRFCRSILRALRVLSHEGYVVHVLALVDARDSAPPAGYAPPPPGSYETFGWGRSRMLAAISRRLRSCAAGNPIVLLGGVNFALLAPLAKTIRPKAQAVMMLFGYEVFRPLPARARFLLRACDHFWAISRSTRALFCKGHAVRPSRVSVLYPCLEPEWRLAFETRPRGKPSTGTRMQFVSVTRMRRHDGGKKLDVLLDAFAKVRAIYPDVRLIIVGDGARRGEYEGLADALEIAPSVRFTGDVSDEALQELYWQSDAFVLPSVKEGFGIVFLEAMAFGRPCVGAWATSIPEIIEHERSGLLANPDDADSLAMQMTRLVQSPGLRARLGEAGRYRVQEHFSSDRLVTNLRALFGGLSSPLFANTIVPELADPRAPCGH